MGSLTKDIVLQTLINPFKQLKRKQLDEGLLKSEFTFGFELEALADEDEYPETSDGWIERKIEKTLNDLFNKHFPDKAVIGDKNSKLQHDGSVFSTKRGNDDIAFEWASPVMKVSPENFQNVIKFLKDLPKLKIYTNTTCGFHHHVGWKGCTERDMIWVYFNLAMDKDFIEKLETMETNNGTVDLFNTRYAGTDVFETIRKAIEEDDYSEALNICTDAKYRLFRIHPYGTLEWRGPRDFMNDYEIRSIKAFYLKFNELISRIIKATDAKTLYGTDITREKFFENLTKAKEDDSYYKTSDNMELLRRVTQYRGDRPFQFKKQKSLDGLIKKMRADLPLFYKIIKNSNKDDPTTIKLLDTFEDRYKDFELELNRLLLRFPEWYQDKQFAESLFNNFIKPLFVKEPYICIQLFRKFLNKIDVNKFIEIILEYFADEKHWGLNNKTYTNLSVVTDLLNLFAKEDIKLPLNVYKSFMVGIIFNDDLRSSYEEMTSTEYRLVDCVYNQYSKKEAKELLDLMMVSEFRRRIKRSSNGSDMMAVEMGSFIELIRKILGNQKEIDEWDRNILGTLRDFSYRTNFNLTQFMLDTDNEEILSTLLYKVNEHELFGKNVFFDTDLIKRVSSWHIR